MVEVTVERRHLEQGDTSDAYLHPVALAATEARLPGAWVTPGILVLEYQDRTEPFFIPPELWKWIQCDGYGREHYRWMVAVPKGWAGAAVR